MKQIFEQAIANVNAAYPSIYTKDDVIKLLTDIQNSVPTEKVPAMDLEALEKIKQRLLERVRNIPFEDCVELELSYNNRIEITVSDRTIANEIDVCFESAVTEVYPDQKK